MPFEVWNGRVIPLDVVAVQFLHSNLVNGKTRWERCARSLAINGVPTTVVAVEGEKS